MGMGCFFLCNFSVDGGCFAYFFLTGVITIIMGFLKILHLSVVYSLFWTDTINWFNLVYIRFTELFTTTNSMSLKLSWISFQPSGQSHNKTKLPSRMGSSFPSVLRALCSALFNASQCIMICSLHELMMFLQPRALGYRLIQIIVVQAQPIITQCLSLASKH